jgi:7-carboxy-7-deazaguanine synthase
MNQHKYRIAEVFGPTIQGEGPAAGKPVFFVRFGGCDYRCSWCDSMHAVDPEQVKLLPQQSAGEIIDQLRVLKEKGHADDVVLSGGNPMLWDLTNFVAELNDLGYWIHVETQGTVFKPWLYWIDEIIVSPKPPSSKMETSVEVTKMFLQNTRQLFPVRRGTMNVSLKYVVFDYADYMYAYKSAEYLGLEETFLSVGTLPTDTTEDLLERYRQVISWTLSTGFPCTVKVLPQMHVLLWGHKLGV